MPLLNLITADPALRHAVEEQRQGQGGGTVAESGAAALTLLDAAFLKDHAAPQPLPAPLLVLGDAGDRIPASAIMESFPKPVRLGWLLGRLDFYRQVLEDQESQASLTLGPYRFAPRERELTHTETGACVKLTDKEAGLLDYLLRAPSPVPRDELLAAVWGYDGSLDTHTLETHLYRLRRALMPEPTEQDPFLVEKGLYQIHPAWRHP